MSITLRANPISKLPNLPPKDERILCKTCGGGGTLTDIDSRGNSPIKSHIDCYECNGWGFFDVPTRKECGLDYRFEWERISHAEYRNMQVNERMEREREARQYADEMVGK